MFKKIFQKIFQKKFQKELFDVSISGNKKAAEELIEDGINVNFKNNYSTTPLMAASTNGHLEIVKQLIKAGADVDIKNKKTIRH